jgi:hypothetical protein
MAFFRQVSKKSAYKLVESTFGGRGGTKYAREAEKRLWYLNKKRLRPLVPVFLTNRDPMSLVPVGTKNRDQRAEMGLHTLWASRHTG